MTGFFYCMIMTLVHQVLGSVSLARESLGIHRPINTVIVFGVLSLLHLGGLIQTLLPRSFSKKVIPKGSHDAIITNNQTYATRLRNTFKRYFGDDGVYGRRGEDFELLLILSEIIEIPSQTYQAYKMSFRASMTFFPNLYATITILECILFPLVMRFGAKSNFIKRRNTALLIDTISDIVLGAVIPLAILVPPVLEFISDPQIISDMAFITNFFSLAKHTLVSDDLDLLISAIPLISSHLLMQTLHENWCDEADATLENKSIKERPSKKRDFVFDLFCSAWGIALAVVLILSSLTSGDACNDSGIAKSYCTLSARPWLEGTRTCHCLMLYVKCDRESSFLYEKENTTEIIEESLSQDLAPTLMALYFGKCPITKIPSSIYRFKNELNIFSISQMRDIENFDSLRIDKLSRLITLYVNDVPLKEIPKSLSVLPSTLIYLIINGNEKVTELPEWIGSSWNNIVLLNLKNNSIRVLPDSIYNLTNLNELNLLDNSITEISPRISNLKNLKTLYLGGNSLTHLPTEMASTALVHVNLAANDISNLKDLPWTVDEITNWEVFKAKKAHCTKLTLAYNPVCDINDISDSSACTKDCSELCDVRERDQRFCSTSCNTSACNFHESKCLIATIRNYYNPLDPEDKRSEL